MTAPELHLTPKPISPNAFKAKTLVHARRAGRHAAELVPSTEPRRYGSRFSLGLSWSIGKGSSQRLGGHCEFNRLLLCVHTSSPARAT